jgi:hypothetical protein
VLRDENLSPSQRLAVSFKIGRSLEKLRRVEEAVDHYYVHVVMAYCDGVRAKTWFDGDARAFPCGSDGGEHACAAAAGDGDIDVRDDGNGTRWKLDGFSHGFLLKGRVDNAFSIMYNIFCGFEVVFSHGMLSGND